MKQSVILILYLAFITLFASCKSDSKKEQEAAEVEFASIMNKTLDADSVSSTGLILIHDEIGKGDSIKSGDYVRMRYKLYLLSDINLDTLTNVSGLLSNIEALEPLYNNYYDFGPYAFTEYGAYYSTYNTIPGNFDGLHEALLNMREGGKATLILPYDIAEGANGYDDIPDYANIVLKVWVTDIGE